jgi:hypothetical protein
VSRIEVCGDLNGQASDLNGQAGDDIRYTIYDIRETRGLYGNRYGNDPNNWTAADPSPAAANP